jgi:hypothetical protein
MYFPYKCLNLSDKFTDASNASRQVWLYPYLYQSISPLTYVHILTGLYIFYTFVSQAMGMQVFWLSKCVDVTTKSLVD